MELVLDLNALGTGENGGNSRVAETGVLSGTMRIVLALGAVAAAWLLMADPQVADLAARIVGRASVNSIPGPVSALLASLSGV